MFVFVQNKYGQPLMPTTRCGKVRRLLKAGKAKAVKRCPFTIRLLYDTGDIVQEVDLGVDAGSKVIGVSASTESKELYAAEIMLRADVTESLSVRREYRRSRRNRKTRYRKARFDNRVRSKHKGWLAPSVEVKISSHLKAVSDVMTILPISHISVETASFDLQKLKADLMGLAAPKGAEYQQGEQLGFWNVREYVLSRDGYSCQCCKGRSKDRILNVHHIESRKTGGDAPGNLITLCETCHKGYHAGTVRLPGRIRRSASFRDAAFMGIMRWAFYQRLKETYPGMVTMTFGYLTKNARIGNGLEKTHAVDARCISGHPCVEPLGYWYFQKKVRCHNRQLHKANILKGGVRKSNQAPKEVYGFRLFDRVMYNGQECFIFGRRTSGYFDIRLLDGTKVHPAVSYKKLKLLEHSNTTLTERRMQGITA
ncbi:MAG: HNH endonuclease [Firmicutes bacterium]|nr:HNH endonuclease [Bacillota bacterium]